MVGGEVYSERVRTVEMRRRALGESPAVYETQSGSRHFGVHDRLGGGLANSDTAPGV